MIAWQRRPSCFPHASAVGAIVFLGVALPARADVPDSEPRLARQGLELAARLGSGWLPCHDGSESSYDSRCGTVSLGLNLGGTVLYRFSSNTAIGFAVDVIHAAWRPPRTSDKDSVTVTLPMAVGRVYFSERGAMDPWFQVALGGQHVGTSATGPSAYYEQRDVSVGLGIGIEWYLSRGFRIGPSVSALFFPALGTESEAMLFLGQPAGGVPPVAFGVFSSIEATFVVAPRLSPSSD